MPSGLRIPRGSIDITESRLPEALALEPHSSSSILLPLLAAILFLFFVSASMP